MAGRMKKIFAWLMKAAAAGIMALTLLCLFCALYYNVPVHYENATGATEYYWEPNRFYSKGTEGFALGRTNNEGFNNLLDYSEGERIDILLMGSSNMEGFNVAQEDNAAALLNALMDGEKYTYNIGTAGHTLPYCVKHLSAALARYAPEDYVVIEASSSVSYAPEELEAVLEDRLPDIPSHSGGAIELLQKLPYLRLFYTKYIKGMNDGDAVDAGARAAGEADAERYALLLEALMEKVARECEAAEVQPLLVYDPVIRVDTEGNAYAETDEEQFEAMRAACEKNGIVFIDLSEAFLAGYRENYRLPFGFTNTDPSGGHINKWGHRIFAQEVYRVIRETESETWYSAA